MKDVWTMEKAPLVRHVISDEEKNVRVQEILKQAKPLFETKGDEGYMVNSPEWLCDKNEESALGLLYNCAGKQNGGWVVVKVWITAGDNRLCVEQAKSWIGNPEKVRFQLITLKEIKQEMKIKSLSEISCIELETVDQGHIVGLYLLSAKEKEQISAYFAEVKQKEKILHTYTGELSNKNAIPNAKKLYAFLRKTYKNKCLTAQQESFWVEGPDYEMRLIEEYTGKLPAIRGLDFIVNTFEDVVARSKEWWNRGGIVTICWHTGADFSSAFEECLKDNINWEEAFIPGSETYMNLLKGMDRAVPYLKELEAEGIPVLWRPFHEFDGGWFWWGKGGSEKFIKLWQMMYSRYTDYWGLNNLIWVLGYSCGSEDKGAWYPGDNYVDLLGADNYESGPDPDKDLYNRCVEVAPEGMPIVYHECGDIPCEEDMKRVPWLLFMPWHTGWVTGENCGNTPEHFSEIYNSDYFITLDELPDLRNA